MNMQARKFVLFILLLLIFLSTGNVLSDSVKGEKHTFKYFLERMDKKFYNFTVYDAVFAANFSGETVYPVYIKLLDENNTRIIDISLWEKDNSVYEGIHYWNDTALFYRIEKEIKKKVLLKDLKKIVDTDIIMARILNVTINGCKINLSTTEYYQMHLIPYDDKWEVIIPIFGERGNYKILYNCWSGNFIKCTMVYTDDEENEHFSQFYFAIYPFILFAFVSILLMLYILRKNKLGRKE